VLGEPRVGEPPAERRVLELARAAIPGRFGLRHHVRGPRHRLDATADEHVAVADLDRVRGRVDGLEARTAKAVDGQPADLDREPRQQDGHAGHVAVVLTGLVGAAEDHVLDESGIDRRALDNGAQHRGGHVVGANRSKRTAVAADGGPHGGHDPRFAEGTGEVATHDRMLHAGPRDRLREGCGSNRRQGAWRWPAANDFARCTQPHCHTTRKRR
jgi:hypothetical protein